MKKKTQDRLLSDAMLAANSWQKESLEWRQLAIDNSETLVLVRSRRYILFIAGLMVGVLGVLLATQAFNLN